MNGTSGRSSTGTQVLLALCAALVLVGGFAIWQIGSEFLRTLALIVVAALAVGIVLVASAVPIRAWRRKDFTGDHYHTDGTKTVIKETRVIDGRQITAPEVKVLQLPAAPQAGAFPELLRAAYQAGNSALSAGSAGRPEPAQGYAEMEPEEIDFAASGWTGDIRS